jgi:hypothetical protein
MYFGCKAPVFIEMVNHLILAQVVVIDSATFDSEYECWRMVFDQTRQYSIIAVVLFPWPKFMLTVII